MTKHHTIKQFLASLNDLELYKIAEDYRRVFYMSTMPDTSPFVDFTRIICYIQEIGFNVYTSESILMVEVLERYMKLLNPVEYKVTFRTRKQSPGDTAQHFEVDMYTIGCEKIQSKVDRYLQARNAGEMPSDRINWVKTTKI